MSSKLCCFTCTVVECRCSCCSLLDLNSNAGTATPGKLTPVGRASCSPGPQLRRGPRTTLVRSHSKVASELVPSCSPVCRLSCTDLIRNLGCCIADLHRSIGCSTGPGFDNRCIRRLVGCCCISTAVGFLPFGFDTRPMKDQCLAIHSKVLTSATSSYFSSNY